MDDLLLPDAKRVRRSDLASSWSATTSRSPSPETTTFLQARLASLYGPIDLLSDAPAHQEVETSGKPVREKNTDTAHETSDLPEGNPTSEDEAYEFRLFSGTGTNAAPRAATAQSQVSTSRIRIGSPTLSNADGGFLNPHRPQSYYFTVSSTPAYQAQFLHSAVDGLSVKRFAQKDLYSGHKLPWRVQLLPRDRFKDVPVYVGDHDPSVVLPQGSKKRKPGKKRRIVLRKRVRARAEKEELRKKNTTEKEEAEKEKRTRRNREKKVKRKEREKKKKAEVGVHGEEGNQGVETASTADPEANNGSVQ